MRRHRLTEEERVAKRLSDILSDIRLDLDKIGIYLARGFPNSTIRRLDIVTSSALDEKDNKNERDPENYLF